MKITLNIDHVKKLSIYNNQVSINNSTLNIHTDQDVEINIKGADDLIVNNHKKKYNNNNKNSYYQAHAHKFTKGNDPVYKYNNANDQQSVSSMGSSVYNARFNDLKFHNKQINLAQDLKLEDRVKQLSERRNRDIGLSTPNIDLSKKVTELVQNRDYVTSPKSGENNILKDEDFMQ